MENTGEIEQNQYFCQNHILGGYGQSSNSVTLVLLTYLNFECSLSENSLYIRKLLIKTFLITGIRESYDPSS